MKKPKMHWCILIMITSVLGTENGATTWAQEQETAIPLRSAHAHNDYYHARPLLDALDHGFCSVEVDIFLVNGRLLVGHDVWNLQKERTLEKLYLEPLRERVTKNDGSVHSEKSNFILLVDIKRDGESVYPKLKAVLEGYREILSGLENGKFVDRAVQVVISGSCPRKAIRNDSNRLVGIDGRLKDLESREPAHLIPMISARWGSHFKWRGKSEMSEMESAKLKKIADQAHAANRLVRFWSTPESTVVWDKLKSSNVDLINTDKLSMLRDYLTR